MTLSADAPSSRDAPIPRPTSTQGQAAIPDAAASDGAPPMAERVRARDWSATPLGPMDAWPAALRVAVDICLSSRFPMFVWWGPQLVNLYNDAYAPILGSRHPSALGRPAREVWGEIWPVVGPQADAVMSRGEATWNERVRLVMERNGFPEETFFDWSYSPIRDAGGAIVGLFCACTEETGRVRAEADRDRALADLGNERARLAEIVERAPAFICTLRGPDHVFELVNPHYYELIGRRDIVGRPIREVFDADEIRGYPELLDRVYQTGEPFVGREAAVDVRRGGALDRRVLNFVYQPLRDAGGAVSGVFVHGIDVTDLIAGREALRASQERFRAAFDQTAVGIVLTDLDGTIREPNAAFAALVGRPVEALVGRTSRDYTVPADVGADAGLVTHLRDGAARTLAHEKRYVRPDGTVVTAQASVTSVRDATGQPVGLFAVVEDVTARKRAEAERERLLVAERAARVQAETLAEIGRTIAGQLDLASLVQSVTDATTRAIGAAFGAFFYNVVDEQGGAYSLYTLSGVPREHFAAFPMPRMTDIFGPTFRGEGAVRLGDVTRDARYGRNAPHRGLPAGHLPVRSYLAVPVISRSGTVLGGLFFGHEEADVFAEADERLVTAIAAQTAVAMDNAHLFEEARRANAAKDAMIAREQAARAEVEHASRMKDEFLATLSHELRTPLNAILGWATLLKRGRADAESLAQGLATIERNARAQGQIIEDLLDMSRIISGKVRLDVQRLALEPILRAAVETMRPAAEAKGIRVTAVLDPLAGPISGDPQRLGQVFWNLLSNAIKFTGKGGRVQVLLERVNSHLEASILDTGEGITPEFLPHVFDRFRQADASITRRHGGLGLGLAIVKQLVELHGGSIRAKSPGPGAGATFTVAFPLAPIDAGPDQPSADAPERRHPSAGGTADFAIDGCADIAGLRVLIVDDEPDARQVVARLLAECDVVVYAAGGADEAIAVLERERPDVLVSDVGMPGEDGYSLIRRIRALPADRGGQTPAIALTAYARAEDRMRAIRSGFQLHIPKPVEPAELITMVASLAGRK